ncbi:hypothetical protein GF407_18525 [candidate division KSB1 bacterium]|nr:hypothetical protein [candidate division KSB1 bacterium]
MKLKVFLFILLFVAVQANSQVLTDEFNRATLGANWSANSFLSLSAGRLINTADSASWDFLGTYKAAANPFEVSILWAASANVEGTNSGGIAVYLDQPSSTASGYLVYRRYGAIKLYEIQNGQLTNAIQTNKFPQQSYAQPGDTLTIKPRTDASGHHFDVYINGQFDGTVTDVNKLQGNVANKYAGVILYGDPTDRNVFIESFHLKAPYISIAAPNGGEKYTGNSTQSITWTNHNFNGATVDIYFSDNSGQDWQVVEMGVPNNGSYSWAVPDVAATTCRIKVVNAGAALPYDVSDDDFEIEEDIPTVSITRPQGGENWIIGTSQLINWNASSSINFVDLYYTLDGGSTRTLVKGSLSASQGSYVWTIPTNLIADSVQIIVEKTVLDQVYSDTSAYFKISALAHLYVKDASGEPGTTDNIVRIGLKNQVNINMIAFRVTDSKSVLSIPIVDNSVSPPIIKVRAVGRTKNFTMRAIADANYVTIGIVPISNYIPPSSSSSDDTIVEIYYDIANDPTLINTASEMFLTNVLASAVDQGPIVAQLSEGHFYYVKAGDLVTPFDTVDDADVQKMADIVLGLEPPDTYMQSGDMDNDGDIDIYDLIAVYDLAFP